MHKLQYERRKKEPRSVHDRMATLVLIIRIGIFAVMAGAIIVCIYVWFIAFEGAREFSKWGSGR